MIRTFLKLGLCVVFLGGCSLFGEDTDQVFFDDAVGPNSQAQSTTLPGDLRGDVENRAHTSLKQGENLVTPEPDGI